MRPKKLTELGVWKSVLSETVFGPFPSEGPNWTAWEIQKMEESAYELLRHPPIWIEPAPLLDTHLQNCQTVRRQIVLPFIGCLVSCDNLKRLGRQLIETPLLSQPEFAEWVSAHFPGEGRSAELAGLQAFELYFLSPQKTKEPNSVVTRSSFIIFKFAQVGDKFGESLAGSQAPPNFWEAPGLPRKFPELPRKFFGDFSGTSLTVELNSNPKVPRKFPKLPRKFPELPRRSAPFSGKPDTLSWLTKTFSEQVCPKVSWALA